MVNNYRRLFLKYSVILTKSPTKQDNRASQCFSFVYVCTFSGILSNMSRVRTKTVKKAAKMIIEKYHHRLTLDFHTNKRICEEIAIIPSKSLRNKIAGFVTHLMKRLKHSQVRGISIKLQEEERERRDNYVPEVSALEHDIIEVDPETKEMLKMLEFNNITGLQLTQPVTQFSRRS
ncbi:40S ribosomal protein S17 [Vespa crabro]|uniref:40S ribosomal protein S17 n=1 Tax=Vespa crabro TaxID=7445 RepID=UPI001EFFE16A|nr:40S ribosomal protein S17 [Vespa crabro]